MPPLEWSVIQSVLLWLILPSFIAAAVVMTVGCFVVKSETRRSAVAAIALIAGMTAGLAPQNFKGELVPYLAVQRVTHSIESEDDPFTSKNITAWEIETGWRSLYFVTVLATVAEILIATTCNPQTRSRSAWSAFLLVAAGCAIWLVPWDVTTSKPWACALIVTVILGNWTSLRITSQMKYGMFTSLAIAVIWCGGVAGVALLSHSARFADLAVLLACSIAGVGVITAVSRIKPMTPFIGPAAYIPGLMLASQQNTYSDIPIASFVLVAVAPAILSVLHGTKFRTWFETRPIVLAILFAIPCVVAVGLAARAEL